MGTTFIVQLFSSLFEMPNFSEHCSPYLSPSQRISSIFNHFCMYFNIFQLPCTLKAGRVACHSLAGTVFVAQNTPFGWRGGTMATETAAAEEFSAEASPHPIAPRDEISRSGNPSLRHICTRVGCLAFYFGQCVP